MHQFLNGPVDPLATDSGEVRVEPKVRAEPLDGNLTGDDLTCETVSGLIPGLIVLPGVESQDFTPCFLLDFSKLRCLLRVDVSYTLSQRDILIRILDGGRDQKIELVGRVAVSRRHTIDTTTFECEFGQALSEEVLDLMRDIALEDRRESDRSQCLVRVNVCRIQRGRVVSQASMVESSECGLRLRTEVPLDIGEQVVVQLPNGEDILVAIVWSKQVNGTHQTGGSLAVARVEDSVLHSFHRLCGSLS